MQEDGSGARKKTGTPIPGRKNLILAGIIIAVIIIAALLAYIIFLAPGTSENRVSPETLNSASQAPVSSVQYPEGSLTIRQPVTFTVKETQKTPVDFVLQPGEPASCGLTCRQLDATITNTGSETAHNVCVTVALHNSRNEVISLNGEPSIRQCIGDIAGGQVKTEPITVNADCGAFATRCIGETLTLQTQVSSDEKTTQFPDQIIKV